MDTFQFFPPLEKVEPNSGYISIFLGYLVYPLGESGTFQFLNGFGSTFPKGGCISIF